MRPIATIITLSELRTIEQRDATWVLNEHKQQTKPDKNETNSRVVSKNLL